MKKAVMPICIILFIMFIGCYLIIMEYAKQKAVSDISEEIDTVTEETENIIDNSSSITGILINIDKESHMMLFQDINSEKLYELPYDESIKLYGKYGNTISFKELSYADVMDIEYSVHMQKLTSLKVSDEIWVYTDVKKFSFDEKKRILYIGNDAYQYTKNLRIFSNFKESEIMDITNMDTLIVRGVDRRILSITVDKGHGYIRVKNDAYFVGGFIEIGQEIIKPITEDMLIPVAEGKYNVRVTNRGYAGEEEIKVARDKESELDLSKIKIEEVAVGHVRFSINPEYAQLYIDDEITEFEDRVSLEYGVHNIRVECAGYETVTTNIKVGSDYANVDITLDEEGDNTSSSSDKADSSSSMTQNTSTQSSSEYINTSSSSQNINSVTQTLSSNSSSSMQVVSADKKIFIEQPTGAEVYLDGNYVGIAPTNTNKVTGTHVITLSKEGYQTRSYTVNVDNDDNDITFSFSQLANNQQLQE